MAKNKTCAIINLTEDETALQPLTNNRPIAALPFAGRYRIIDFILSDIAYTGIDSVALFIGDSGRSIYDHIRSGDAWDLNSQVTGGVFTFSQQHWKHSHLDENPYEDFYYNQRIYMERSKAKYVFIAGSEIIANVDIKSVRQQHVASGKDVTVLYKTLPVEGRQNYNKILVNNGEHETLVSYDAEEATETIKASLNMYLMSVERLKQLIDLATSEGVFKEIDDLIVYYIERLKVNSYEYTGYAAKIDSIQSYYQANMDMLNRQLFASVFYSSIPIITKPKNGAPTYYAKNSLVEESIIGSDTSIFGEVRRSILNRRVKVKEDAKVDHSIILQGVEIGEGAEVSYAIVDKGSVIEPGAKLIGEPGNIIVIGKNQIVKA